MNTPLDKMRSIIGKKRASPNESNFSGGLLTSLDYEKNYYDEHKDAGLDYLAHGYWQESYAKMVADATLQATYESPSFFDGGCACGSLVAAFKKTNIFGTVLGVDLSEHMVGLGRSHFGLSARELISGSITEVPVESHSLTLVHSSQVLEHIPEEFADAILDEFARILRPGGRAFLCLDAIRHGETKEIYMGDPTHVNIQPIMYWTEKIQARGLYFDVESYNRFVKSPHGPTAGDDRNFYDQYPYWSAWTLIKV